MWLGPVIVDADVLFPVTLRNTTLSPAPECFFRRGMHDLRHEALSRLADDGVPVHELQLLAGHSSITTTQRYMNARASSLAESMRQARERRVNRVEHADEATAQIG
jgi:integrase